MGQPTHLTEWALCLRDLIKMNANLYHYYCRESIYLYLAPGVYERCQVSHLNQWVQLHCWHIRISHIADVESLAAPA